MQREGSCFTVKTTELERPGGPGGIPLVGVTLYSGTKLAAAYVLDPQAAVEREQDQTTNGGAR